MLQVGTNPKFPLGVSVPESLRKLPRTIGKQAADLIQNQTPNVQFTPVAKRPNPERLCPKFALNRFCWFDLRRNKTRNPLISQGVYLVVPRGIEPRFMP